MHSGPANRSLKAKHRCLPCAENLLLDSCIVPRFGFFASCTLISRVKRTDNSTPECLHVQLQLVGLSVMDTARKLKMHCRNDVLYEGFVKDFMPEHGRSNLSSRCSRQRFAIECDVLAAKQQFEQLLARGEVRSLHYLLYIPLSPCIFLVYRISTPAMCMCC